MESMDLRLFIHTDNAAFGDTPEERNVECARILRLLANKVEAGELHDGFYSTILDENGNAVGRIGFKND